MSFPFTTRTTTCPNWSRRVGEAMQPTGRSFELICVDDGSRDDSARVLAGLAATPPLAASRCT